jgi:hypothetical protein
MRINNGCKGHGTYGNKYKCSSYACMNGKKWIGYLEKELRTTKGGLDGLYQVAGQWRSEHLDVAQAA